MPTVPPLDEEGDEALGKFSNFDPEFIQAMCNEMMKVFKGKGVMPSSSNYAVNRAAAQKGLMACFDKTYRVSPSWPWEERWEVFTSCVPMKKEFLVPTKPVLLQVLKATIM
ncbi:hypothetical protein V2J09_012545 [Rumex salicifolius]